MKWHSKDCRHFICWVSNTLDYLPLHSSSRLRDFDFQMKCKTFTLIWKQASGPLSSGLILFLLSPGKTLMMSLLQEFLDIRSPTVAALFLTSMCSVSWYTDTSIIPLFVKHSQNLESPWQSSHVHLIRIACSPFPITLLSFTQLSIYMLAYSTLWPPSLFSNDLLYLILIAEGVDYSQLDISSLPMIVAAYNELDW